MSEVASPCVRNCCLNEDDNCLGCFRSVNEIMEWHSATDERKLKIVNVAGTRKFDYSQKNGLHQFRE